MKKGQAFGLNALITVIVVFVIVAVAAIYSVDILDDTRSEFCDYSYDDVNGVCYNCNTTHITYNSSDGLCHNTTAGDSGSPDYYRDQSFNSTSNAIDGVMKIPDKMPTLGNVVIAAIIISVLLAAFGGFLAVRSMRM